MAPQSPQTKHSCSAGNSILYAVWAWPSCSLPLLLYPYQRGEAKNNALSNGQKPAHVSLSANSYDFCFPFNRGAEGSACAV